MKENKKTLELSELEKAAGGAGSETVQWICPDCPSVEPVCAPEGSSPTCPNCGKPMVPIFMTGGRR